MHPHENTTKTFYFINEHRIDFTKTAAKCLTKLWQVHKGDPGFQI